MNDRPGLLAIPTRPLSQQEVYDLQSALNNALMPGCYAIFPDCVRLYQLVDGRWQPLETK